MIDQQGNPLSGQPAPGDRRPPEAGLPPQAQAPQPRDYARDYARDQDPARGQPQPLDQRWLDGVLGSNPPPRR
jgi:hypothetical protein